jgi:hypothetical protein
MELSPKFPERSGPNILVVISNSTALDTASKWIRLDTVSEIPSTGCAAF